MIAMWSSDHSAIHGDPHLRLAIANDLSPAIGITRIDQKWPYETKASIQHLWPNAHPRIIIKQKEKQSQGRWLDAPGLALLLLRVSVLDLC
jgi:hypothetical protein